MKVLEDSLEHTSPEDLRRILEEMGIRTKHFTAEAVLAAIQAAIKAGKFKAYEIAVVIVNGVLKAAIGRGLSVTANAVVTRILSILAGPIGWVLTGLWVMIDIAAPAYRVIVPAVIYVAYLRLKQG